MPKDRATAISYINVIPLIYVIYHSKDLGSMTNMKEAIVHKGSRVEILDSEIPTPGPEQVIVKVVVIGCNPKD
jgi:hypothetical protein